MINIKVLCDSAKSWQLGFQDPCAPIVDAIALSVVFGIFVCVVLCTICVVLSSILLKEKTPSLGEPYEVQKYRNFYHAKMEVFGKRCSIVFVWTDIRSKTQLQSTAELIHLCYHAHYISHLPHRLHSLGCYNKVIKVYNKVSKLSLDGTELIDSKLMGSDAHPKQKLDFIVDCLHQFQKNHDSYFTHRLQLRAVLLIMEGL